MYNLHYKCYKYCNSFISLHTNRKKDFLKMCHHVFNDVGTMLMLKSVFPSQESTNSMEIGDDNLPVSVFIPLSHYVYSFTSNTGYESAVVYVCPVKPPKRTNYLSKVTLPKLSRHFHYYYNYYGAK